MLVTTDHTVHSLAGWEPTPSMPSPELQSAACCWQSQPNTCHPDPPPPGRLSSSLRTHALRADRAPSMQHMRAQGEPAQTPRPLQLPQTGPTPPGAFYMGPLRAGSVAAASVDDQPSSNSLAFAGEPKGSSSVMAPASGLLRGRCGPGCPAMGARSLQAAHCSARPHSQLLLYAAALHVSYATPIRCHLRTAAPAQLNLIACSEASGALAGRSWPSRPLPAGAPFPLGVSAAVGSRPTARAAAPRAEWASPGPSSGKKVGSSGDALVRSMQVICMSS